MNRWWTLFQERFPPGSYLPMVTAFVLANAAIAAGAEGDRIDTGRLIAVGGLALSFFVRLRLFDEIKDHQFDLRVHPGRPLARGIVTVQEAKRVTLGLVILELGLAAALGAAALVAETVALAYSFLMYREFFVGSWLRPRLTLYAVAHTAVSALLGYTIAAAVTSRSPWMLPAPVFAFGVVNWMLFNVFEFARKTFAPAEERPGVASYSKIFGATGAGFLTVSQIVVAIVTLALLPSGVVGRELVRIEVAIAAVPAAAAVAYGVERAVPAARTWRVVSGAYVVLFFAVVATAQFGKGG